MLAALSLAFAVAPAGARELPPVSVTPFVGYAFAGKFRDEAAMSSVAIDDAVHAGILLNIRQSANTQWEIAYGQQQSSVDAADLGAGQQDVKLDIRFLQFGGTYVVDGERARPFVTATLGGTQFDPDPLSFDKEHFFSFGIGAGWYFAALERLDIRLEGRVTGTVLGSDTALFCETGPDQNVCAVVSDSDIYWQFHTSLGFAFRF